MPDDDLRIHERHVPVRQAENDLAGFLLRLREKYALTSAEFLNLMAGAMQTSTAFLVRAERKT